MIYISWGIGCDRLKLVIMGHYLPFYHLLPPKKTKNLNFEKMKTIAADIIILHKWYRVRQTKFFVILGHFLPFYPSINQKIKILKNWKTHLEMPSFYTCTKNHDHMMHASWDMECERHNFLSFWATFCPFVLLKFGKNVDIILLHMCTINEDHMVYGSRDIRHDGQFFVIFCSLTLLTTRKIKLLKKWKKCPEILSFYTCVTINENHMMYGSWDMRYRARQTEVFLILDDFLPFYSI